MNPLPMTAAPMSLRRGIWRLGPPRTVERVGSSRLDGLAIWSDRSGGCRSDAVPGSPGDERPGCDPGSTPAAWRGSLTFSGRHRTSACQVQKSRDRPARRAYDPPMGADRHATPRHRPRAGRRGGAGRPGRRPRRGPAGPLAVRAATWWRGPASAGASSPSGWRSCSTAGSSSRATPGPSTGGRPPRQLTFRADAGHVLVADLGATSIDVAVTTLDGRILGHHDEPAEHRRRPGGGPRAGRGAVRPAARDDPRPARAALGHRHRRPGPGRVPDGPPDLAADHARLGRLSRARAVRRPLRRAGLGRQRRQRPRPRRVAVRRRRRPRQRGRRQGRDRHRRGDHRGRPAAPRRPGLGRRRRPHPGVRGPGRRVPLREHRLPRGDGRRRGDRARRRGGRPRRPEPAAARGAGPPRRGHRGGRRAGRLVRRSGGGRAAPGGRAPDRARCSRAS